MKRRIPQYSELRDLVQFKAFDLDRRRARLAKATNVWELRDIAKRPDGGVRQFGIPLSGT